LNILETARRLVVDPQQRVMASRATPVGASLVLDEFSVLSNLQGSLEPEELLKIFSAAISDVLPHEGLSLMHSHCTASVGDGGFFISDWPLYTRGEEAFATLRVHAACGFDRRQERLLVQLSALLSQPMHNALICETLRRQAREDGLTGLLNRTALEKMLPREVSLAHREQIPLCVLMLDLDHFKRVNDQYGHAMGDRVLALVASVLRDCLRLSDLAFRYGGEEFAVILPDTPLEGARNAAERINQAIREQSAARLPLTITVSIGIAALVEDLHDVSHACPVRLLQLADRALYLAKQQGRDRVLAA
jgi:diguanylate cyclase (GGDEF)-like protein